MGFNYPRSLYSTSPIQSSHFYANHSGATVPLMEPYDGTGEHVLYLHLADGIGDRLQESVQPLTLLPGHVPHLLLGYWLTFNQSKRDSWPLKFFYIWQGKKCPSRFTSILWPKKQSFRKKFIWSCWTWIWIYEFDDKKLYQRCPSVRYSIARIFLIFTP